MKLFNKGDILFARRNTYLKRVSVAPFDGVCSGDIIVLEPILEHIVEGFLPIFMQFEPFENKIIALSAGAFSKRIKWKQLAEEDVFLPSTSEQKKIAEIVWDIQDTIEKSDCVISTTEILKKGLLNELLTKGIGHKKFKLSELGEIPKEWNVIKIEDIANIRRGASPRPIKNPDYFSDDGPGWIRIGDVTPVYKYINKTTQCLSDLGVSKSVKVTKGNLIMSICATIGKPVIVDMDACIHDGFVLFQNIKANIDAEFLYYVLLRNEEFFKSQKQEGTQGNLNTTIVGNTAIALPNTIEEQNKITSIFNIIDILIKKSQDNLNYMSNSKKKLTNDYLSGKLIIPREVL
jgi:type I restriction enzyme S subunit